MRCNLEVTVVARGGAQEADGALLAPGLVAARYTKKDCTGQGVVHHGEAAVSPHNDIIMLTAQDIGKKLFHCRQAVNAAVVAAIRVVLISKLTSSRQGKQRIRQIQLFRRRLAPGHVQGETRLGCSLVAVLQLFFTRFEFFLTVFVKHDHLQGWLKSVRAQQDLIRVVQ